ncbi:MAG: hypothetical protein WDZ93_04200 [Candidatus Paceibacterota bacterium]
MEELIKPILVFIIGVCVALVVYATLSRSNAGKSQQLPPNSHRQKEDPPFTLRNGLVFGFGFGIGFGIACFILGVIAVVLGASIFSVLTRAILAATAGL